MGNRYAEDVETSFADTIVAAHREKIEKEYIVYFVDLPTALKPPPPSTPKLRVVCNQGNLQKV